MIYISPERKYLLHLWQKTWQSINGVSVSFSSSPTAVCTIVFFRLRDFLTVAIQIQNHVWIISISIVYSMVRKTNSFVCFLGESATLQLCFEIYWPLCKKSYVFKSLLSCLAINSTIWNSLLYNSKVPLYYYSFFFKSFK